MGPSLILCSLLIVLNEIYREQTIKISCIFDIVLQTVLRECRVNTVQVLTDCIAYGYCQNDSIVSYDLSGSNHLKRQRIV